MREHFDGLKEYNKERRGNNYLRFIEVRIRIEDLPIKFTERNEYHFTFEIKGAKGQYWPSSSKWQLGKKLFHGTADSFLNWAKKRLA